jgi:hypothetical protein
MMNDESQSIDYQCFSKFNGVVLAISALHY